MNRFIHTYVQLSEAEKQVIDANNRGLDIFFKALFFEDEFINGFIASIDDLKSVDRKTARIKTSPDISSLISRLRDYLSDNFAYQPTTQEIYWLVCQYLFSKYPGFRAFN